MRPIECKRNISAKKRLLMKKFTNSDYWSIKSKLRDKSCKLNLKKPIMKRGWFWGIWFIRWSNTTKRLVWWQKLILIIKKQFLTKIPVMHFCKQQVRAFWYRKNPNLAHKCNKMQIYLQVKVLRICLRGIKNLEKFVKMLNQFR